MEISELILTNWHVKLVSVVLIVAAYIDGKQLRVPNWITFPMVISGWIYNSVMGGWGGLGESLLGTAVGLATLYPLYAVGGMGAGDVKLMAGIGAWLGGWVTFYAFCLSTIVGALMALVMAARGNFKKHYGQFLMIINEWMTHKDANKLYEIAAERKPRMMLLPYGIPICIGSLIYFALHYKMV